MVNPSYFQLFIIAITLTAIHGLSNARPIKPIPEELIIRAKREMNFKGKVNVPPMIPTTSAKLTSASSRKKGLITMGVYYKDKIFFDKNLKLHDLVDRSIIYHELIHHVQRMRHGPTRDCNLWMRNEREAYRLQEKYLLEKGIKDVFDFKATIKLIRCPSKTQT